MLPTSHDLSDRQRAEAHFHEVVAVRDAIAENPIVRKRLMVLALHDKVRTDALAVRRDTNATTLHGQSSEAVHFVLFDAQQSRRRDLDPFAADHMVDEEEAYQRIKGLSEPELDTLITMLVVEALTGHGQRQAPLVQVIRNELGVSVRKHWTPTAAWLAGYQKAQLAHLTGELKGPAHGSAALRRKKSELVEELAALFSQAAEVGKGFEDPALAERVNAWLPASLMSSE